jgi:FtsH-binding integral membrane protein
MGSRRRKTNRTRRASSADIRFTLVIIAVGALALALGSVLLAQVRERDWRAAAISGGIVVVLLAVTIYSVRQRRP